MAGIKLDKFSGIAPKISPELLPDRFAQIANNCKLISGDLVPFPQPFLSVSQFAVQEFDVPLGTTTTTYNAQTLFGLYDPKDSTQRRWLLFKNDADVVVYSGADDDEGRFYYTDGEGARVSTYRLIENNWILIAAQFPVYSSYKDYGWWLALTADQSSVSFPLYYDLGLPIPPNDAKLTTEIVSYEPPAAFKFWRDANGTVTVKSYNLTGADRVIGDGFLTVNFKRESNVGTILVSGYDHGLTGGESVRLDYPDGTTKTVTVLSVPDTKTFTFSDSGADFETRSVWKGRVQGFVSELTFGTITVKITELSALGSDILVPHGLKDQSPVTITGMSYYEASYTKDTTTTLTITLANHGLPNGAQVVLDSFTGVDPTSQTNFPGQYEVQNVTTNTFKITFSPPYIAALSGTCHINLASLNTLSAPITVIDENTFTYFAPGFEIGAESDFKTPPTNAKITYGAQAEPRTYVYTYLTPWGEESVPSKPSDEILVTEAQPVIIRNIPTVPPDGKNFIQGVQVYRTVASPSGTDYYRLATCWFPNQVAGYSRTNNVSRIITYNPHNLAKDDRFRLVGVTDSSFNVTGFESPAVVVSEVIDRQTFEFAQTGADVPLVVFTVGGSLYLDVSEDQPNKTARYWGDPETGTYDFRDDFNARDLSLVLESTDYAPPPEKLTGLTAIQNDIMAGFVGHELYFSEIRKPHAWPVDFRLRLDYDIVGLVQVGGELLVLTDGYPYVVSGNDPATMVPTKLDALYPCVSKRSIVRMPYGVVYATFDGLAVYNAGSATQLITQYAFDADAFTSIDASTIIAMTYRNRYIAKHSGGGFVFEIDGQNPRFVTLGTSAVNATAMWYDAVANEAYYTNPKNDENLIGIYEWDELTSPPLTAEWKSKVFVTQTPINFGAAKIEADFETGSTIIWEDASEQTWDGGSITPPSPVATNFALTSAADIAGDDLVIFNWSDYSVVQAENIDSADTAAYSLKFSPNGSYLAIYTHDGNVRILETTGWTVVKTFTSPTDYGTLQSYVCFAWSPDSRYLAMSGDDTDALLVWDSQNSWANVYTGTYTSAYLGGAFQFLQLDWSPDGAYLACANFDYDAPLVFDTSDWSDFLIDMTGTPFTAGLGDYATGVQFKSDGASMYLSWSNSGYVHLAIIDTSTWAVSQDFSSVTLSGTFDPPDNAGIYLSPDEEKIVFQSSSTFNGADAYHLITMASGSPVSINAGAIYSGYPPTYSFPGAAWKLDSLEFACVVSASGDLYSVDASTGVPSVELASGVYLYAIDSKVISSPTPTPPSPSPTPAWDSSQTWGINDPVTFKLWADKELVATRTVTSNAIFRLPTGYKADKFELGVEGNVRIRAIYVAETPRGLKEI